MTLISRHALAPASSLALALAQVCAVATATPPSAALAQSSAAPATASPPMRIRGTLVFADTSTLIVKTRNDEILSVARAEKMSVSEVYPIKLADIKQGSYIGAAAMPQPDGSQKALEVLVFPEAARGAAEGHTPWDLAPQSTMTNATVAEMAPAKTVTRGGRRMRLAYKGGEQMLVVPPNVPVVSFKPGSDALLVPGAKVLVTAQEVNGQPTALRVLAGRNGFAPPM